MGVGYVLSAVATTMPVALEFKVQVLPSESMARIHPGSGGPDYRV